MTQRVAPLTEGVRLVGPSGEPTAFFRQVWNTQLAVNAGADAWRDALVVAGTGLGGGGALGTNPTLFLADTGVTAGTYGSAGAIPVISVNAQGQITSASNVAVSVPATFLDLTDTPSSYAGQAGRFVAVNPGETGLEFVTGGGPSGDVGYVGLMDERPVVADFATVVTEGTASGAASDDPKRGLTMTVTSGGTGDSYLLLTSTSVPVTGTRRYTARVQFTRGNLNFPGAGIAIRNSTNGRSIYLAVEGALNAIPVIVSQTWTNTTFNSALSQFNFYNTETWLRIEVDSTGDVRLQQSDSGADFFTLASTTLSAFLTAAGGALDLVGLRVRANSQFSSGTFSFWTVEDV